VEFALPGVIESALVTKDHIGYILKDIEPVILCVHVPEWLVYIPHEYVGQEDEKTLAAKFSIDIN
jgi:hypothetical protein